MPCRRSRVRVPPSALYLATLTTHPLGDGPAVSPASASPPDLHYYRGRFGGADTMPLYRDADATRPNVPAGLLELLTERYGRPISPEDVFAYGVGVLGTGAYATRFAAELREAGPRLPLTADPELFEEGCELGRRLTFLHSRGQRFAREDWRLPDGTARIVRPIPSAEADCPDSLAYDEAEQEIRIGDGAVGPITPDVWVFATSGYDVVQEMVFRYSCEGRGRGRPGD